MCPNFIGSDLKSLTSYQKILSICSLGYKNLLNFTWYTNKFHNCNHTIKGSSNFRALTLLDFNTCIQSLYWAIENLTSSNWLLGSERAKSNKIKALFWHRIKSSASIWNTPKVCLSIPKILPDSECWTSTSNIVNKEKPLLSPCSLHFHCEKWIIDLHSMLSLFQKIIHFLMKYQYVSCNFFSAGLFRFR